MSTRGTCRHGSPVDEVVCFCRPFPVDQAFLVWCYGRFDLYPTVRRREGTVGGREGGRGEGTRLCHQMECKSGGEEEKAKRGPVAHGLLPVECLADDRDDVDNLSPVLKARIDNQLLSICICLTGCLSIEELPKKSSVFSLFVHASEL